MDIEYLNKTPSNSCYKPPIDGNQMILPLADMSWEDFERLCLRMVEYVEGFERENCEIFGRPGQKQDGIDIYAKKGVDSYFTFQCKRYKSISAADLEKIFLEFEKGTWFPKTRKFVLCTSANFSDVKLQNRFEEIRDAFHRKNLEINKWDFTSINRILKTHPQIVYDFFGSEWCKKFCGDEVYNNSVASIDIGNMEESLKKASLFMSQVKNYFEKKPDTHIVRKETHQIINWIKSDLIRPKKNILVLEGEKGMGKSVILKDVYEQLINENNLVLGIKADKYYATNPRELENKIFVKEDITFSKIIRALNTQKRQLVVIIDQLDALSQTLSSNREYIQTYNRIINELLDERNIRVIISSRSYDLKYDAELSVYRSNEFHNIKATLLSENEVAQTLQRFNVSCSQKKVLELLKTPHHLEIFTKLPNKGKINLNIISSLKDLYDALWGELIIKQRNLKLLQLLYKIAVKMYEAQQITISNQFANEFDAEIMYLLSNQLIVIQNSNLQFFHQTFYDYCFARQFVEHETDIYQYLKENEQNLEVRSIIKMVLEYLREYDHKKYITNTTSILKSSKYRFHIKALVISNLGILGDPSTEEKRLIDRHILKNPLYEDIFIHSVFSKDWSGYLLEKKVLNEFLFPQRELSNKAYEVYKKQSIIQLGFLEKYNHKNIVEYRKNAAWIFFRNNINHAPLLIINFLDKLPDFSEKNFFIERILMNLDDWQEISLLPFFEKYIPFNEESKGRVNFWFYQILAKIFEYHQEYVFGMLAPIFNNMFYGGDSWHHNELSHDQEDLLKKLYEQSPERSFDFVFKVFEKLIEDNKDFTNFENIDCPFYNCTKFIDGLSSSKDAHVVMEEFLVKHLGLNSNERDYIIDFFKKHKNSNSVFILRILVLALNNDKRLLLNEISELISIIYNKNGLNGYDDKFQLYLRQLIANSFPHFSKKIKNDIAEILLTIKSPYDSGYNKYKDEDGNQKVYFYGFGKKQYYFIKQLPKNEIEQITKLKKVFQEFYRRFGDVDSNKAHHISSSSGVYTVGPPLSQKAYSKMDLQNWKNSMVKFNDNYHEGHGPEGGKHEHSRAFEETVKNEPDKYYDFINGLFHDEKVSIDYVSKGIDGLIASKYSPDKVKELYKRFIRLELDRGNTLYAIWQSRYFIEHKLVDKDIISFLSESAKNHPNPEKPMNENDPSFDSLNTVRGAAIHKIMQCYEHGEFAETIFETAEKGALDPQISVRVAVMQELAYLNHLDLNRSFKIFMELIEDADIELLKNSFRTSQYFNHKFHFEMYPYFKKIMEYKDLHNEGNVIVLSWLIEEINDKNLYAKFVRLSDEAKLCALKIAEANLFDKNGKPDKKSFQILNSFLNEKGEDFASAYSGIVLRKFKHYNFEDVYPFLLKYSRSKLCMAQPRYFFQLLLSCAKDYPIECLTLVEKLKFDRIPNIQLKGHYDKEPVQLILAIYTKLNINLSKNRKYVKKSLDIFDSMLKHNHLRISVNQAIQLTA